MPRSGSHPDTLSQDSGFSLLELLAVLAVVGILVTIATSTAAAPRPDTVAANIEAALQQARFEAVKRNRAVVFAWNPTAAQFESRVKSAAASAQATQSCANESGDAALPTLDATENPRVIITTNLTAASGVLRGVVWQPNGLPRACSASSFAGGTFTVTPRKAGAAPAEVVDISAAGRIRQQ